MVGIDAFVLDWPRSWRDAPREGTVFEAVESDVIPQLRAAAR
jgi:hypothetical protein